MREIKFRAKTKSTNEWVDGSYVYAHKWHGSGAAGHFIVDIYGCDRVEIDINTLGQFTGMTDSSLIEIYENDILLIEGESYAVMYNENEAQFILCNNREIVEFKNITREVKVIGNIYDNPELLKGE